MSKTKVIISYSLAKDLLSKGFRIIDIDKNNKDSKRSVFIFELTKELELYLEVKEGRQKTYEKHKTDKRRDKNNSRKLL